MPPPSPLPYAASARLVLEAPLVIDATIRSARRVKGEEAAGVAPGHARFVVDANTQALIRGAAAIPARFVYLADVPLDSRGRAPRLKRLRVLLFARPIAGYADRVQLIGVDGQQPWSPGLDAQVRGIAREIVAPDAPAPVLGLGDAFHVPGTLPGEGETQIFLRLANEGRASLQVLRRPGQAPRWSISLGDFIDESASVPPPESLLWYRLACGLPRQLPASSLAAVEPAAARIAQEDYALVLRQLGPCNNGASG